MGELQLYEKVVKVRAVGRRLAYMICGILGYIGFCLGWIAASFQDGALVIQRLLAGIGLTLVLVLLTKKYFRLEYEYSFAYGVFTLARIYDKRKYKEVTRHDIKDLLYVARAEEEAIKRAEGMRPARRIVAVSDERADNIWLMVSGGKDREKELIFFEADERSLAILRRENPYAVAKER